MKNKEEMQKQNLIKINEKKIVRFLAITALFLIMASIFGQVIKYTTGYERLFGFTNKFYLDHEGNIPTFFSSSILLFSSMLIGIIYLLKKEKADSFKFHWLVLCFIFFVMSVDEATVIHELTGEYVQKVTGELHGVLYYAWVIPGSLFVLFFALSFLKFFLHLSVKFKIRFALSAAVFISGTLGIEMISSYYEYNYGIYNLTYSMIATIEETLEMSGIILLIQTLFKYIAENEAKIELHSISKKIIIEKANLSEIKKTEERDVIQPRFILKKQVNNIYS